MRVSIGFSGIAGSGVNTSGLLLAEILAAKGYSILGDKEYASIIKGDNNCFFLYVSDKEEDIFITKTIDYFIAFDDFAVSKNQELYDLKLIFNLKSEKSKHKNVFALGAAMKIFGLSLSEAEKLLSTKFSGDVLQENLQDIESGYEYIKTNCGEACSIVNFSQTVGEPKDFPFGNELIAKGAIKSGLDFYAAYPMTPATSILEEVVKDPSVTFFQGEDEIAAAMAMLGAKYAGKRAMTGTSGGGFALMTESISFSNIAELGGVYVLAQRDGPSTGTPTFTGQSDLLYSLNASFGDTFPIVLAPSTFEEAYTFIGKALNRSDIYQHPVIFLTDKQLSESYKTITPSTLQAAPILRGKQAQSSDTDDYKRYDFTEDGISPVSIPGTPNTTFIATSYEHDDAGATSEQPVNKAKMMQKRFKKMETFVSQEFNADFYGYEIINPDAEEFFLTRGINSYVLRDHIRENPKAGLIIIKTFQPFDLRLKEFLQDKKDQIKKLTFVEMNYSGQMESVVTNQCELLTPDRKSKITHQRKYTLYPIYKEDLV